MYILASRHITTNQNKHRNQELGIHSAPFSPQFFLSVTTTLEAHTPPNPHHHSHHQPTPRIPLTRLQLLANDHGLLLLEARQARRQPHRRRTGATRRARRSPPAAERDGGGTRAGCGHVRAAGTVTHRSDGDREVPAARAQAQPAPGRRRRAPRACRRSLRQPPPLLARLVSDAPPPSSPPPPLLLPPPPPRPCQPRVRGHLCKSPGAAHKLRGGDAPRGSRRYPTLFLCASLAAGVQTRSMDAVGDGPTW